VRAPRGEWGFRRLAEVAGGSVVDCFVNSQRVGAVVDQATTEKERLGIEAVWLQLGVRCAQAIVRPGEDCRRLKQCLMTPGTHVIFQC
jgi:predicted CoA-binding protein